MLSIQKCDLFDYTFVNIITGKVGSQYVTVSKSLQRFAKISTNVLFRIALTIRKTNLDSFYHAFFEYN